MVFPKKISLGAMMMKRKNNEKIKKEIQEWDELRQIWREKAEEFNITDEDIKRQIDEVRRIARECGD